MRTSFTAKKCSLCVGGFRSKPTADDEAVSRTRFPARPSVKSAWSMRPSRTIIRYPLAASFLKRFRAASIVASRKNRQCICRVVSQRALASSRRRFKQRGVSLMARAVSP